jgi:hypothetical protein
MIRITAPFSMLTACVALALATPPALVAHGPGGHSHPVRMYQERQPEPTATVMGTVLPLACYLEHGATGDGYKMCASSPLTLRNISAVLLTDDDEVFFLLMDHPDAYRAVSELFSQKVVVRAREVTQGPLQALVIRSIKPVKTNRR